jgi:hypothetical protein
MNSKRFKYIPVGFIGIILAGIMIFMVFFKENQPITSPPATESPDSPTTQSNSGVSSTLPVANHSVIVDDFEPQPYQGEPVYYFNRLGGDRGAINESALDWGNGQVTTTISYGKRWGGVWMSLNHPIRENAPVNFSALLPPQILPAYQSRITGIKISIADSTPNKAFKIELKVRGDLAWENVVTLDGGRQEVSAALPTLVDITELVWVLDQASAGEFVVLDSISFTTTTQITDTATAAFVWSYGMLLNNWDPVTGLVRDKAKDATGEFDAIQTTGSLAATTAVAEQLGIINHSDAVEIVEKISDTLLHEVPRFHGLWPHFVKRSSMGEISIVPNTEWSSVDTVIAAVGLLAAQHGLGMDTAETEQMLEAIEWDDLMRPDGISHGYSYAGDPLLSAWDVFGGESWLVALAYAGVSGKVAPINYPSPPTANGSGFIDELAWLFAPPPLGEDYWGTDWATYRVDNAAEQIGYFDAHYPESCFSQLDFFGLSAAEVPDPSMVPQGNIYQAFGIGGSFASPNDGAALLGQPVVAPHYAAMITSLYPDEAVKMWDWLIENGYFSPLTNVESLMFQTDSNCDTTEPVWNQLKGSWNLSLQALGWGRYLAERDGQVPVLWQAATENSLFSNGYLLLASNEESKSTAVYISQSSDVETTPIWDNSRVACNLDLLYLRAAPGTRIYKRDDSYMTVIMETEVAIPNQTQNRVSLMWEQFLPGLGFNTGPRGSAPNMGLNKVELVDNKQTVFGSFQTVWIASSEQHNILTGRLDSINGSNVRNEWYVCGYGLVKFNHFYTQTIQPGGNRTQSQTVIELVSFTPLSTNENLVRFILVDMQLGDVAEVYRARISDEETTEALRRWDAGIRVENIEEFERMVVDGVLRIVNSETGQNITGMDAILTSD